MKRNGSRSFVRNDPFAHNGFFARNKLFARGRLFAPQKSPHPKKNRQDARAACRMLAPSLLGLAVFVLLPFAETVRRSFCDTLGEHWQGLQNYRATLQNEAFQTAARNTARFLGLSLPLLMAVSFLVALMLCAGSMRHTRRARIFKTTFLLPLAIPTTSIALLWKALFAQYGFLNTLLTHLGWERVDFLSGEAAFRVLLFTCLWKNTGLMVLLWCAGMDSVSNDLYEAAAVDGANRAQRLVFITLPHLGIPAFLVLTLSILQAFKVFREAYLVAGSYPPESIYLLQHLFNNWFLIMDLPRLTAAASLLVLALFVPIALLARRQSKGSSD